MYLIPRWFCLTQGGQDMRYAIGLLLLLVTTSVNAEIVDYGFVAGNSCQNGMCQRPIAGKAAKVIKAPIVVAEKIVKAPFVVADRIDRRCDNCEVVEQQFNSTPQCYGSKRCRRGVILWRWRR